MPYTNNNRDCHVHDHTGITSCNQMHCHIHPGVTSPPIKMNESHYHEIIGSTTYDFEHLHTYYARTGPAIPLPNGHHTHYAAFRTSFNAGHKHEIMGFTVPVKNEN